ncbi:phage portal protein [Oceanobacillus caeni]
MTKIGFLDVFKKNKDLGFMLDLDLIEDTSSRVYMKRLALQICINFIARTISQSELRVKKDGEFKKDELYYRLNVKPNLNDNASVFWEKVIYKLIYDNECLIIQADNNDLLVADSFNKKEYAVYEDVFQNVVVKNHEFKPTYPRSQVLYLEYNNEKLSPLIDGLFSDYGELFGKILVAQKRKGQIRGTVDIDAIQLKDENSTQRLQEYIDKLYKAFSEKDVAIVPQQKGYKLEEQGKSFQGQSVDEVDKVTNGFLSKVAMALGVPLSLIKGDMADVEKQTRNYMTFCIDPLLKKIGDELNMQLFDKTEYLNGDHINIRRATYSNMFDVANAVDKLRSAGVMNGNELRDELGLDRVDDKNMDAYVLTKNYSEQIEGGEDTETENNG